MQTIAIKRHITRALIAIENGIFWLAEGIGFFLPDTWVRRCGPHPWRLHMPAFSTCAEAAESRTLFGGIQRYLHFSHNAADFRFVEVTIPSESVVFDLVPLPKGARRDLEQALRLRVAEYSPFPPADTMLAHSIPVTIGNRLWVPVAVTRRSVLNQAKQDAPAFSRRRAFVAVDSENSDRNFIFDTEYCGTLKLDGTFLRGSLTLVSVIALLIAVSARMERSVGDLRSHQRELIQMIKVANNNLDSTNQSQPVAEQLAAEGLLSDYITNFEQFVSQIPPSARASSIVVSKGIVKFQGYIAENDLSSWPENREQYPTIRINASNYPGFSSVDLTWTSGGTLSNDQ